MILKLTALELKITEKFGKIVYKFPILHHNWECDGYGYIVNDGKNNKVVTTNHTNPVIVDSNFLNSKIREYGDMILETNEAIKILNNGKG